MSLTQSPTMVGMMIHMQHPPRGLPTIGLSRTTGAAAQKSAVKSQYSLTAKYPILAAIGVLNLVIFKTATAVASAAEHLTFKICNIAKFCIQCPMNLNFLFTLMQNLSFFDDRSKNCRTTATACQQPGKARPLNNDDH